MAEHVDVKTKPDIGATCSGFDNEENGSELHLLHCKICLQAQAKYTCPRCNLSYCSVACYQSEKHSRCSEAFYKDCVVNELKDLTNTSDDRQRVLEMLARDLEERTEDDTDQEDDDLADRLKDLDLDEDISTVWNRLTSKEKEEFARMLQDGRLARLIEMWVPWWRCQENQRLVKEQKSVKKDVRGREVPDILQDITDIKDMLKDKVPSSDCKFELLNILSGYIFVTRIHNGGHLECPVDSTQDMLDTCAVLKGQTSCGSVGEAVQMALDSIVQKNKESDASSQKFNLTVLEDVQCLVLGPGKGNSLSFMFAALSDMVQLLQAAYLVLKKELKSKSEETDPDVLELKGFKNVVFKAEKKLMFMLSWLQRYGSAMHQLLPLLQFEIETRESEIAEVEEIKSLVEKNMDKVKPVDISKTRSEFIDGKKIIELNEN